MNSPTPAFRIVFTSGDESYIYLARCSRCHKSFIDDDYNFCPMCATPLSPTSTRAKRLHGEPAWQVRARSLNIPYDDRYPRRGTTTIYRVECRILSIPTDSWEPTGFGSPTYNSNERLDAIRQLRRRLDSETFPDIAYRVAVYEYDLDTHTRRFIGSTRPLTVSPPIPSPSPSLERNRPC